MTDIKKLAGKHARGFDDPKVKHAIVHALQEYQKSVVIDVLHSDPSTALLAERIVRTRPMPERYHSVASARVTFRQLVEYAVEMGRELERLKQPQSEQEYGWEWASNPSTGPHLIHGSDSKESAERAMESIRPIAPVRIMVRHKAVPGEWREA